MQVQEAISIGARNGCFDVDREEQSIVGHNAITFKAKMAKGTRLRQLEIRLEAMEFGISNTQETMLQTREDLAEWRETMRGELERQQEAIKQCQKTMEQQGLRIDSMLSMLSSLPQFHLSPDFPPKQASKPILSQQGNRLRTQGAFVEED